MKRLFVATVIVTSLIEYALVSAKPLASVFAEQRINQSFHDG